MGLFGGKKKKAARKAKDDLARAEAEMPKVQRRSRRIAAPSGVDKKRASGTRAVVKKPSVKMPAARPVSSPLQLESGTDDVLDNSKFIEPGMAASIEEASPLLSDEVGALEDAQGGSLVPETTVSHSGDQPLLDFLINKASMITEEQATQMRQRAEEQGVQVDVIGVQLGFFTEDALVSALTQECWVPHLKVDKYDIRKKALDTIEYVDAVKYSVLPVDKLGGILNLAMVNPLDTEAIRVIESKTQLDIKKVVATRSEIDAGIAKYYQNGVAIASDAEMKISQDLAPQRVTQMLNRVEEIAENAVAAPDVLEVDESDIADIDDVFDIDSIADIDDLLGDDAVEEAMAPAIIESISIDMDDDAEEGELVAPEITSRFTPSIAPPAPEEDVLESDVISMELEDIADVEIVDDEYDDIATNDLDVDLGDSVEELASDDAATEPAVLPDVSAKAASPVPDLAPAITPAVARSGSMLQKEPATSSFKAAVKPAQKPAVQKQVIELTQVMEDEFQHAITHGKSHVFEKWSALQMRNRILNAVVIPKELDEMLDALEMNDKIVA